MRCAVASQRTYCPSAAVADEPRSAYVIGHPVGDPFVWKVARDTNRRVFALQYRKSTTPETAWPAPLIDALSAWKYITEELAFPPSSVQVMGSSAGGHLTLALAQQLHATSQELPGSLTLISPWVDLTLSFPSIQTRPVDFLTADWLRAPIKSLTRYYTPEAVRGPFFSPTLAPPGYWKFLDKTPVFVNVGEIEGFIDEVTEFVERIKSDDVPVTVNIVSCEGWSRARR
ncbi:hypothetical protein VHUM_00559 [Vanrija humicola]|uniref:Alpha/beta hydrolase fold-3 domain-containing protein n=1 Tax=Vanrija humicola TaxID=5417 RepID=A0A7D8V6A2_VANHU|nr:hypothetical protein VHUM_00559 [Vanrija humicola]